MKTNLILIATIAIAVCSCGSQRNIIRYNDETEGTDEVVNVGYGSRTRSEMTSSANIISSETGVNITYKNIGEYLQGKVAGVQVSNVDDAEPTIIIRGAGTLNSGTTPLYILDGIEISSIGHLDPNDIYSVEVLRDASAAIYGAKAANGVLVFTTKSRHDLDEQERIQRQQAREAKKAARKK